MFSKTHKQGVLALILANIIWGAAAPIFKLSLQNIPPFTLAFLRFAGASLLLLPLAIPHLKVAVSDLFKFILIALFGITINITFFFLGLQQAPSVNAPIIGSSGPIFGYLFAIFILREKPHIKVLIGLITSLIGILIVVGQPLLSRQIDGQVLGNFFFVIATLGAVVHLIVSKQMSVKYHAITITFWSFVFGTLSFLPFFLYESSQANFLDTIDWRGWLGLYFGIFLSSAVAYFLFEWGLKRIEAQEIGIFAYIDPIIAAILAFILLGEAVTLTLIIGSIFIFGGIYLAEGRLHYHPLHKLRK